MQVLDRHAPFCKRFFRSVEVLLRPPALTCTKDGQNPLLHVATLAS